jgi:hypothetical protein
VNAAFLLMTSTLAVGADPAPAAPPAAPAPVVVSGSGGCSGPGCGAVVSTASPGLFSKFKGGFGCKTCGGATARPNLLDTLKAKFGKHHASVDCGCATPGCSTPLPPGAAPAPAPTSDVPKKMDSAPPKPTSPGAQINLPSVPSPGAVLIPALPVTPVSGPRLNGTTAPY